MRSDIESELLAIQLEERILHRRLTSNFSGLNGSWRETKPSISNALADLATHKKELERQRKSFLWLQNLKYPIAMLGLLLLTPFMCLLAVCWLWKSSGISIVMVVNNTLQLLIGFRSLPSYKKYMDIGNGSLSVFGIYGSCVEVVIIFYLMTASLVGLYSVPLLRYLKPKKGQTSLTKVMGNCVAVLVLSSALPVLSRTLVAHHLFNCPTNPTNLSVESFWSQPCEVAIFLTFNWINLIFNQCAEGATTTQQHYSVTSFDLLGDYGRIDWLSNFLLVWSYNLIFAITTALSLITKFTSTVRRELCKRFNEAGLRLRHRQLSSVGGGLDGNDVEISECDSIHTALISDKEDRVMFGADGPVVISGDYYSHGMSSDGLTLQHDNNNGFIKSDHDKVD